MFKCTLLRCTSGEYENFLTSSTFSTKIPGNNLQPVRSEFVNIGIGLRAPDGLYLYPVVNTQLIGYVSTRPSIPCVYVRSDHLVKLLPDRHFTQLSAGLSSALPVYIRPILPLVRPPTDCPSDHPFHRPFFIVLIALLLADLVHRCLELKFRLQRCKTSLTVVLGPYLGM